MQAKPYASDADFFGSFFGQSTSAMFSRFAWKAEKSKYAELSDVALSHKIMQKI